MTKKPTLATVVGVSAIVTISVAVWATQGLAASGGTGAAKAEPKASKTPTGEPPPKTLAIGSVNVRNLSPGVSITQNLPVTNSNGQDVELQSVKTTLSGPSPAPTTGSCTSPQDFEVLVAGFNASTGAGTPVTIRKNSTTNLSLTVRMHNRPVNQDACKGRTWTFTFTATATSK